MIEIPVPGGTAEAIVARPDDGQPHPGVLFFMDAIGLRPQIQDMADRIASWGYVVLAPNVFHRSGRAEELAPRRDLREPGAREEFFRGAMGRVRGLTTEKAVADIDAYVDALTGMSGVTTPLGVTGYCMGARLAVRAATRHPEVVAACGGFHGGGLADESEDSPHLGLGRARAEFCFGHADNDGSMPPEAVDRLGRALTEAGLTAENRIIRGAPHGYTMADTSMYDAGGAAWHDEHLHALLDRCLQ